MCSAPSTWFCADTAKARGHCAVKPPRINIIAGCSPLSCIDFISIFRRHALISFRSIPGLDRRAGVPLETARHSCSTRINYTDAKTIQMFFLNVIFQITLWCTKKYENILCLMLSDIRNSNALCFPRHWHNLGEGGATGERKCTSSVFSK